MSNDTSFRFPNAAPAIREQADGAVGRFPDAAPVQGEPHVRKEVPIEGMLEGTRGPGPAQAPAGFGAEPRMSLHAVEAGESGAAGAPERRSGGESARFPNAAPVHGETRVQRDVPLEGMLEGTHAQKPKKPKKPVLTSTPFLFDLRDADIAAAIEREGVPVLLCFVASWCIPCKQIKTILIQIAHEFQDKAYVATVELDNAILAVGRYGINAAPTTIVFYGGQEVSRFIGANTSSPKIRKLLKHAYEADRLESPDLETLASPD